MATESKYTRRFGKKSDMEKDLKRTFEEKGLKVLAHSIEDRKLNTFNQVY